MKLKDWLVCLEDYESGEQHYHVTIQCYRDTKGSTVRKWFPKLDVEGCHPKGGSDSAWNYTLKDKNYAMKEKAQGFRSDLEDMKKIIDETGDTKELWQTHFSRMIQYHRAMTAYQELTRKRKYEFDEDVDVKRFKVKFCGLELPTVVLGASQIGKTAWAENHFKNPLLVSDIEDLRKYDPEQHDGVVFDDVDFTDLPRCEQIHLLDIKKTRSIHMRNYNWERPKGLKMIFTCNKLCFSEDPAIERRYTLIKRDLPFYD